MLNVRSHANKEALLKAADEILKNYNVVPFVHHSEELSECFFNGVMAFRILEQYKKKKLEKPPIDYGIRMANATKRLGISYIILDAVQRSDMKDGGASYIANYVKQLRQTNSDLIVESILRPSIKKKFIPLLINSNIDVISYTLVMEKDAKKSVKKIAEMINEVRKINKTIPIRIIITITNKTKLSDIISAMRMLRKAGADLAVINSQEKCKCDDYIFEVCQREGYTLGFKHVISKPRVRIAYDLPEFISSIHEK